MDRQPENQARADFETIADGIADVGQSWAGSLYSCISRFGLTGFGLVAMILEYFLASKMVSEGHDLTTNATIGGVAGLVVIGALGATAIIVDHIQNGPQRKEGNADPTEPRDSAESPGADGSVAA